MSVAPLIEGSGRRWVVRSLAIGLGMGFVAAEAWWRLYELPRRAHRDEYYAKLGVTWNRII